MTEPRIAPVTRADADEHQLALFDQIGEGEPLHLFGTLAHHSKLMRAWLPFGGRLLFGGSLADRERELAILRTSARCGSNYEWGQHVGIARSAGLADNQIVACADERPGEPLAADDLVLLAGVDELLDDHELSDEIWAALQARYDDAGMIEFTLLVGHYAMLAGLLRSARVATERALPTVGSVS